MLENLCKCEFTNSFKIEADFGADPIWCNQCGWNLDIEEFPLTDNLKVELDQGMVYIRKSPLMNIIQSGNSLQKK